MSDCTVYIDEAGDLGFMRGTRWFVLSAVIVEKGKEPHIRSTINQLKNRLNVNEIHLRRITDFYKRAVVVQELNEEDFIYANVIVDTNKMDLAIRSSSSVAYNYICRMLIERVSWLLRDTKKTGDIVLSARGTSRDNELITYIKDQLIPYNGNQIANVFEKISAKTAASWDLLQLADVCATTMFCAYQKNGWGFCTPCYSRVLQGHLYSRYGNYESYGLKYFSADMKPDTNELKSCWPCTKKERTPGTTTT